MISVVIDLADALPRMSASIQGFSRAFGRAARDGVSADLSFRESNSFYSGIHLSIRRRGSLVLSAPLSRFVCRGCSESELDTIFGSPLRVVDLDGDQFSEAYYDEFGQPINTSP